MFNSERPPYWKTKRSGFYALVSLVLMIYVFARTSDLNPEGRLYYISAVGFIVFIGLLCFCFVPEVMIRNISACLDEDRSSTWWQVGLLFWFLPVAPTLFFGLLWFLVQLGLFDL